MATKTTDKVKSARTRRQRGPQAVGKRKVAVKAQRSKEPLVFDVLAVPGVAEGPTIIDAEEFHEYANSEEHKRWRVKVANLIDELEATGRFTH